MCSVQEARSAKKEAQLQPIVWTVRLGQHQSTTDKLAAVAKDMDGSGAMAERRKLGIAKPVLQTSTKAKQMEHVQHVPN